MIATSPHRQGFRTYMAAMALAVLAGCALTAWRVRQTDRRWRDDMLHQTTLIAWAIRADQVNALTGTEEDLASPTYARIKHYLMQARTLYPDCRFLYIMRKAPDGRMVFLVDSEPPESPTHSPPGQTYDEASAAFRSVFTTGRANTEGPIQDRWGRWVSSSVPLYHPLSDRLVGVLGMDIDARRWQRQLAAQAWAPAAFTALVALLLSCAYAMHRAVQRRPRASGHPMSHLDPVLAALLGLAFTGLGVYMARDSERIATRDAFRRLAGMQAGLLQQAMFRIGDNYLEGVARLFEGSEFVDRREFHDYTGYLLRRPYAQAWGWAPAVLAQDRVGFERAVRMGGAPAFAIWNLGADGARAPAGARDVYYPLCYLEPPSADEAVLGFDLGSDDVARAAMESARASRLVTATAPLTFASRGDSRAVEIVFRPVFARDDPGRLSGFALVVLRLDALLYRALSRESTRNDMASLVSLFSVTDGAAPAFLAANESQNAAPAIHLEGIKSPAASDRMTLTAPIFAFGTTYAFVASPGEDFLARHTAAAARRALAMGLALTAMVTALVSLIAGRRAALERQVAARTAELRASESSYHGLFNSIRQAIYIQDPQGRFLDANDGAVAMYGYTREELVGQTPDLLSAPGRNDLAALGATLQRALSGTPQYFEFWGRRKNGEVFPKDVWVSRGTYFGRECIVAVANDVSERKRAEDDKARLQAQLVQAQKMESVGRLAGGVAHDFNNMLQAILGNASLALEEKPAGNLREYLEEIQKSAGRSADLTRQLLAFASRQTASPRVIDLNDTIGGMLKMLRRLIGEDVQLVWMPGSDLWPIRMDPSQVDQIMANLAVNARDAIGGVGKVSIETVNTTCPADCGAGSPACRPGDYVVLSVRDTGRGMDEETLAHLFEPFYTTKAPGKGVGLGLATVFGIVKQNEGFISVQSAPGQGTVFRICLPRTHLAIEPTAAPPASNPRGGGETILLVEDERSILRFGEDALRRLGYRVMTAHSPGQAMERARACKDPIHLLISDVVLPDMNGRELAQVLCSLCPDMRCLFMSGYTADVIAERGILDENVQFIQKPFSTEALAARIRAVLDGPAPG